MNVIRCPLNDGQRKVIINMDQVPILNSSGLGSLIAAMKQITAAGGRLILVHVHERIMTLLKITKLISVFEIHPTVEDGLQQMRSQ
jgi:anti-sigma B factor antagonist